MQIKDENIQIREDSQGTLKAFLYSDNGNFIKEETIRLGRELKRTPRQICFEVFAFGMLINCWI